MSEPTDKNINISLSYGRNCTTTNWSEHEQTLLEFSAMLTQHVERDVKDGPCFVPGIMEGGRRAKSKVLMLSALVYDVDGGMSLAEMSDLLDKSPYYAVVYTTYSHLSVNTKLNKKRFDQWWYKADYPDTPEDGVSAGILTSYLEDIGKNHLKSVYVDEIVDNTIILAHDPVEKFRVVFPFKHPFYMDHASDDPRVAAAVWSLTYEEIGKQLGIPFDPACTDPSRLHFFPACPSGAERDVLYHGGELLDYREFDIDDDALHASAKDMVASRRGNTTGTIILSDEQVKDFNLTKWFDDFWGKLRIQELFNEFCPDKVINDKGDKTEIVCPFEDDHTTTGGNATIISDYTEEARFGVYCLHASCQTANHSALEFLAKMLEQEYFTINQLMMYTDKLTKEEKAKKRAMKKQRVKTLGKGTEVAADEDPLERARRLYGKAGFNKAQDDVGDAEEIVEEAVEPEPEAVAEESEMSVAERHALRVKGSASVDAPEVDDNDPLADLIQKASKCEFGYELAALVTSNVEQTSDPRVEARLFAYSQIPMQRTDAYHMSRGKGLPVTPQEFEDMCISIRQEVYNFRAKMAEIAAIKGDNHTSHTMKRKLQEYLGMDAAEFNRIYTEVRENVTGSALPEEVRNRLVEFDSRYAKLRVGRDVDILDTMESLRHSAAISARPASMRTLTSNEVVQFTDSDGTAMEINLFDYWMEHWPEHRVYNNVTFDPDDTDKYAFNLWRGFPMTPKEGDCAMIEEHIYKIWCAHNHELYQWVMMWFAQLFQDPGTRYHSAITLIGSPGAGKSVVFQLGFERMLRHHMISLNNKEQLVGRFNGEVLGTALLCVSEESVFQGDLRARDMLKDMITTKKMVMEEKFRSKSMRGMYARMFFITNHLHALALEEEDRRFCVLQASDERARDGDYFAEMADRFLGRKGYDDMAAAFMYRLQNLNPVEEFGLDWDVLNRPPQTHAKVYQTVAARSVEMQFFWEYMVTGGEFVTVNTAHFEKIVKWDAEHDVIVMSVADWRAMFRDFVTNYKTALEFSRNQLGNEACFTKGTGLPYQTRLEQIVDQETGDIITVIRFPSRKATIERAHKQGFIQDGEYNQAMAGYLLASDIATPLEEAPELTPSMIEITDMDRPELDILYDA